MKAVAGMMLVAVMVAAPVSAQWGVGGTSSQKAPLSETQRQQIGLSLDALAMGIERAALAQRACATRASQDECRREVATLENMRAQQQQLCLELNIPARQHGCP